MVTGRLSRDVFSPNDFCLSKLVSFISVSPLSFVSCHDFFFFILLSHTEYVFPVAS